MIIEEHKIEFEPDGTLKLKKIVDGITEFENRMVAENVPIKGGSKIIAGVTEITSVSIKGSAFVKHGMSVQQIAEITNPDGLKLTSSDGSKWIIQVSNTGQLSAVKIT